MGNEVMVCAGVTHRAGLLDDYERQLERAGVPFHLEIVPPMPAGPNSMTMRRKIDFVEQMAKMFCDYDSIYITDGWDVLFFGTRQELIHKAPLFRFAAEANSYPETVEGTGDTPWRFANAGCMVGTPGRLIQWVRMVEAIGDLDILDQAWLNRHLDITPLDTQTMLFYVVAPGDQMVWQEDGRARNMRCDTFPNFLHFSGGVNADQWRPR